MWFFVIFPFVLQGILIGIDEVYFHRKRGLPQWERIGHPLDTLSFLICLGTVLLVPYSTTSLKWYIALSIFSCLMVTKDEFIHKHHSPSSENWFHACLFLLHPIVLTIGAFLWPLLHEQETLSWLQFLVEDRAYIYSFFLIQTVVTALFFFYQIIFWNFVWKNQKVLKL